MEQTPEKDFRADTTPSDIQFGAVYFDGRSSAKHLVEVTVRGGRLEITFQDRPTLHFSSDEVRITSRLGNTPRSLRLPENALLETDLNDAVDRLEEAWHRPGIRIHRLESSWKTAVFSILLLATIFVSAFVWGIPLAAKHVAYRIPDNIAYQVGSGTLDTLDEILFEPSTLIRPRKDELTRGFANMASKYPRLPLNLIFRKADMANAFALPNGTVVVTDELVQLAKRDEEIYAVLAHEIGHIEHRHTVRMALESSAIGVLLMVFFGDASQAAGLLGALPAIYANATFSRDHETEADTFALAYMTKSGLDPAAFADILERLTEDQSEATSPDALRYLSSHPATHQRIARFRKPR